MALITKSDVTQWLEATNFAIGGTDLEELPEHVMITAKVLGRLTIRFDTSEWTTPDDVPQLVRSCIGMLVAGWHYNKQYAETGETKNEYGEMLTREANRCIEEIMRGNISINSTKDLTTDVVSYIESDPTFKMAQEY